MSTTNPTPGFACKSSDVYALCAALLELFFGPGVGALARDRTMAPQFSNPVFVAGIMSAAKREMAFVAGTAELPGEG
jgi:hypothetical protein